MGFLKAVRNRSSVIFNPPHAAESVFHTGLFQFVLEVTSFSHGSDVVSAANGLVIDDHQGQASLGSFFTDLIKEQVLLCRVL